MGEDCLMVTRKEVSLSEDAWDVLGHHLFPHGIPPDVPEEERRPVTFSGGYPDRYEDYMILEWDRDFTPEDEFQWQRLLKRARRRAEDVDDDILDPYWNEMRAFWNNSNPNSADMVRALKATIKALREMMKE
jgi:hypothetical protein